MIHLWSCLSFNLIYSGVWEKRTVLVRNSESIIRKMVRYGQLWYTPIFDS